MKELNKAILLEKSARELLCVGDKIKIFISSCGYTDIYLYVSNIDKNTVKVNICPGESSDIFLLKEQIKYNKKHGYFVKEYLL